MEIRIHAHGKLREWACGGDRGHSPQKLSTRSHAHLLPRPRSDGCDEATAPGPRPEAAGPLNAPGLTPVLLASLRAPHQPACRRGGVPVTPAAPGALADWIDWLQFPLGRSWDFFCPLSPFARSSPSLLDQATLSRFTSSSPVPLLFHFTTFVTVHISIPFAAQGKGSQPPTTPAP